MQKVLQKIVALFQEKKETAWTIVWILAGAISIFLGQAFFYWLAVSVFGLAVFLFRCFNNIGALTMREGSLGPAYFIIFGGWIPCFILWIIFLFAVGLEKFGYCEEE